MLAVLNAIIMLHHCTIVMYIYSYAQAIERLNHLHLTVSHTSILRKLDELGEDFDRLVHKWKDGKNC